MSDKTNILDRLTHNNIRILNWFERGILPFTNPDNRAGIAISYFKIIALHNNIFYGAFSLKNAWSENVIDIHDNPSDSPIFYRSMHLQNAYVTYNSCIDYIYQILYFYYDLESCVNEVRTHEEVLALEENIKPWKRDQFDKKIKTHNSNLYKAIKKFRQEIKGLNTKANIIKHDAGFWVEGNHIKTFGEASINIDGENINLTDIITPRLNSISEEIEFLIKIHNSFVKIERVLFEELDYSGQIKTLQNK